MKLKIMKDPQDLDVFEGGQATITRKLDEIGAHSVSIMVGNVFQKCTMLDMLALVDTPLELWQRAAYEADCVARKPGASVSDKGIAEAIWLVTNFLQLSMATRYKAIASPEMRKKTTEMFPGELPDLDRYIEDIE